MKNKGLQLFSLRFYEEGGKRDGNAWTFLLNLWLIRWGLLWVASSICNFFFFFCNPIEIIWFRNIETAPRIIFFFLIPVEVYYQRPVIQIASVMQLSTFSKFTTAGYDGSC